LANTIKDKYATESELIRSSGGVFEVFKDGNLIFSKHKLGRFPEDKEVLDLLAK
jgi:selT/selW/selH-like putative selenoprotein